MQSNFCARKKHGLFSHLKKPIRLFKPLLAASLLSGLVLGINPGYQPIENKSSNNNELNRYSVAEAAVNRKSMELIVNFGRRSPHPSMSGFLHSLYEAIPADRITDLRPVWWRIQPDDQLFLYNKARNYGANVQVVISDGYGEPRNNWYGHGAPWENDWQNWENYVRELVNQYKGMPVYWDVWNEPDVKDWNKGQWNGTRTQFFETYMHAYKVIREELGPDAMIGGPSYANFEPDDIKAFIRFCSKNNVEINFLTWHELGAADQDIPSVTRHLRQMQRFISQFPNVNYKFTLINESVGPDTRYKPGEILGYLYHLQRGKAGGTNKACWSDENGQSDCYNGTLDGILSTDNYAPRAAWWAYKAYADCTKDFAWAVSRNRNIAVFAGRDTPQIILGYFGNEKTMPKTHKAQLLATRLRAAGIRGNSVEVSYYRIPATGTAPLKEPKKLKTETVELTGGYVVLDLPDLILHEGLLIQFNTPSGS
ncbi:MAG: hypothetical protein AAGI66_08580 [Cyanobacteria bacterium P01_H01_bin.74]